MDVTGLSFEEARSSIHELCSSIREWESMIRLAGKVLGCNSEIVGRNPSSISTRSVIDLVGDFVDSSGEANPWM